MDGIMLLVVSGATLMLVLFLSLFIACEQKKRQVNNREFIAIFTVSLGIGIVITTCISLLRCAG